MLDGMRQILIVNEATITGHDPLTGAARLWSYSWPGSSSQNANSSQVVPVGGDRLWVSKGYDNGGTVFAVRRDAQGQWSTEKVWSRLKVLRTKFTNVAIYQGSVYGLSDGILECVDLATGKGRWKDGRYGHGQILRVGDLLLVESDEGEIALVEASPAAFHELGRFQAIEGQTWNTLCLWGSYLLVRNSGEAACYKLPLTRP